MISVLVTIEVDPSRMDRFMEIIRAQAAGSRAEPGCRRWEVSRKLDQENVITISELFDDAAALQAHYDSPHFKRWIENTSDGIMLSKMSVKGKVIAL
jgi:quinol monooxygenase YgiN